jgi:hypothetical protein
MTVIDYDYTIYEVDNRKFAEEILPKHYKIQILILANNTINVCLIDEINSRSLGVAFSDKDGDIHPLTMISHVIQKFS